MKCVWGLRDSNCPKKGETHMKLRIRRDQAEKKGIFGGHKGMRFSLSCRVEISEEEEKLIEKYKVNDYVLTWRDTDGGRIPGLTVKDLVGGYTAELDDVATLLNNEEVIKGACNGIISINRGSSIPWSCFFC